MTTTRILTTAEVLEIIRAHGVIHTWKWILADRNWSTVSAEWVSRNHDACLAHQPPELITIRQLGGGKRVKTFKWIKGCRDCENISLDLMEFGGKGHALSVVRGRRQPTGNLLGVPHIMIDENYGRQVNMKTGGGHAPNWFIDHDLNLRLHEGQGNVHLEGITAALWKTSQWGIAA